MKKMIDPPIHHFLKPKLLKLKQKNMNGVDIGKKHVAIVTQNIDGLHQERNAQKKAQRKQRLR